MAEAGCPMRMAEADMAGHLMKTALAARGEDKISRNVFPPLPALGRMYADSGRQVNVPEEYPASSNTQGSPCSPPRGISSRGASLAGARTMCIRNVRDQVAAQILNEILIGKPIVREGQMQLLSLNGKETEDLAKDKDVAEAEAKEEKEATKEDEVQHRHLRLNRRLPATSLHHQPPHPHLPPTSAPSLPRSPRIPAISGLHMLWTCRQEDLCWIQGQMHGSRMSTSSMHLRALAQLRWLLANLRPAVPSLDPKACRMCR